MAHEDGDPAVLPQWKLLAKNYHDNLEVECGALAECLAAPQEDLVWNDTERDIEQEDFGEADAGNVGGTADLT